MTAPDTPEVDTPVTLLGRSVPGNFERTFHVLEGGRQLACDGSWRDVLAVVEHGEVHLEAPHGGRLRLVEGDVLCFALTGAVTLRSTGISSAVLAAVRRRDPPPPPLPTDDTSNRRK